MDSIRFDRGLSSADLGATRVARQVERESVADRVSDGLRARTFTQEEIAQHTAFHNMVLYDTSRVGALGDLRERLQDIFGTWAEDRQVDDATRSGPSDSVEACDNKRDYAQAYNQAKREHAVAHRTAAKLGPGLHQMPNGDTVEVGSDPSTGVTPVTTRGSDGSSKRVIFNPSDAHAVQVHQRHADGREETLTRLGTQVSRQARLSSGEETIRRWNVNDLGQVGQPS